MNEQQWLACGDPEKMLESLRGKVSDRKLRLFAVACCRRIWHYITDSESQAVVDITEQSADGPVDVQKILSLNFDRLTDDCGGPEEPFRTAFMVAGHIGYSLFAPVHGFPYTTDALEDALGTSRGAVYVMAVSQEEPDDKRARYYDREELKAAYQQRMARAEAAFRERQIAEQAAQCFLLRCIFGNPFRPVTLDPTRSAWNSATAVQLARTIYYERAFDRLPILADALEDAGCADEAVLGHCREPVHVRGCWVVDLLLGKE